MPHSANCEFLSQRRVLRLQHHRTKALTFDEQDFLSTVYTDSNNVAALICTQGNDFTEYRTHSSTSKHVGANYPTQSTPIHRKAWLHNNPTPIPRKAWFCTSPWREELPTSSSCITPQGLVIPVSLYACVNLIIDEVHRVGGTVIRFVFSF